MLRLRTFELENFACFERLNLEIAADSDQPLTVIRAENASGKTTFLRSLRWALYGEKGLPGKRTERFSVHPAWWRPSEGDIVTKASVLFETDGGRYEEPSQASRTFKLTRSVKTIPREAVHDDEPDFQRVDETLTLLQRSPTGDWQPVPGDHGDIERRVELLLPWGLRDFFFMDADEATDFVGGRENKPLPKKQVIEKTTAAINQLLGLGTFQDAIERVGALQEELQREVSRASGDVSLQEMQDKLDRLRDSIGQLEAERDKKRDTLADLEGQKEQVYGKLQTALKEAGSFEKLENSLTYTNEELERAGRERAKTLGELSSLLEDDHLLAGLMAERISQVHGELEPLHQRGLIPHTHVPFVKERLAQEECICGESLAADTPHRANVQRLIDESIEQEEHYNVLGDVYFAARAHLTELDSNSHSWAERARSIRADLGGLDERISTLTDRRKSLRKQVDEIDLEEVQVLKGQHDALETQIETLRAQIADLGMRLKPKEEEESSLDKKVNQRQRNEQTARDRQLGSDLAANIRTALSNAYKRIQSEQVEELSARMNMLFGQMAANVPDDESAKAEAEKATVRMISKVGVRPVQESPGQFEIFALNRRNRILPPVEINGASRRVLALSFILALGLESNTEAPLVADSLLNMMSGKVRTNTLLATVRASRQPILLLTRADLAEPEDLSLVNEYAGVTYTFTGQWDAKSAGRGGDVINQIVQREVAIACHCGPREYCKVCQRVGDADREGWTRREVEMAGKVA